MDRETVERAATGDQAACRALYERLAGPAFALIRRLVQDWAAAEDIFQDAMLAVLGNLRDYRGEAPFGAWARQIVLRRCLMHLRSPWQRARETFGDAGAMPFEASGDPTPSAELLDLERAVAALPATARAVLWLHDAEGLTHEEIGRAFGKTPSFSKSQLARAHAQLRALLRTTEEKPCPVLRPVPAPSR